MTADLGLREWPLQLDALTCSVSLQRYGDLVRHGERRNLRSKRMTKSISAPARETRAIDASPAAKAFIVVRPEAI